MRVILAERTRVASFAPGRKRIVLTVPGRCARYGEPAEFLRSNSVEHAPVEKLDTRFMETMRSKGWLK